MKNSKKIVRTGVMYLIPACAFLLMFCVIPFVWNMVLSLQKWDGINPTEFVGLSNFARVFERPVSMRAFTNSIIYAFSATAGSVIIGLLMAVLILRLSQKEGSIFRVILYSPAMLPSAIIGVMFVFFLNPEMGLLNNFLELIGLESLQHVWLQEKGLAMACLVFVATWKGAGSVMIIVLAAMQSIPDSLYESSLLDGASYSQQIRKITIPLVLPTILLATTNTLGANFKSYDIIFTMTQGGPGDLTTVVPIIMKKTAFIYGDFGTSAAMGVLFTIVVAVSLIILRKVIGGESYEY